LKATQRFKVTWIVEGD
jgi:hypothetical protein